MSLQPRPIPSIPDLTAKIAGRAFRKGNVYIQMRDGLGSVRAVVDHSGSLLWMSHYTDFGSGFGSVGAAQTIYRFTGEMLDGGGLLDLRGVSWKQRRIGLGHGRAGGGRLPKRVAQCGAGKGDMIVTL
ncbi:MAG: hypothetical protein JNM70_04190 [Anaerolineae bacterium]|nr:hypothetical protein [Anaerolineae bacterium]